ncbi:MAG: choice-of-anchor D domain-containing protein [Ignavibacteria bacterium]|nr:choice-of-anchor D domain-containing protein [Ignavibacteria bacterium]
MKTLRRSVVILILFIVASAITRAQCNYGYGSITGYEPYYYNSYTVGETMPVSYYTGYPYAIYYANSQMAIDLSTNAGSTWTQIATKPMASCYYCYGTYSTSVTIPWSINPSTQCLVRYREVPASGCAYNYTGYNYYNYSIYGYYFTIKPGCYQPAITQQPADQVGCVGSPLTINVIVDQGPSASTWKYEWFKGTTSYSVSSTTPNLTFSSITLADAGTYKLTVTNQCSNTTKTVTTRVMTLTVKTPAAFTGQPQGMIVCPGKNGTLSAPAVGTNVTYQWMKDGVSIPNATSSTYTIVAATTQAAGTYSVRIQADCGPSVTSANAVVQVPPPPVVTQQPVGRGYCPGSSVTLSPTVTGTNLSFQWYKGDAPLAGETGMTLTINDFQKANSGYYWLKTTSSNLGCITSQGTDQVAVYTFDPAVINSQPMSKDVCLGSNIELSVGAEGTDVQYQWNRNGTPIPNANSYLLVLNNAAANQSGDYTVDISSVCNSSVRSNVAKVAVLTSPKITAQPQPQSLLVGNALSLSIGATDGREVTWYRNEMEIARGTSATYTKTNITLDAAGYYRAVVSNVCGTATSRAVKVDVVDPSTLVPKLRLSSEQLNVGDVPYGYDRETPFDNLIENSGVAALEVSGISFVGANAADFSLVNGSGAFTVQPGETAGINVLYKPSVVGPSTAQMVINSNAAPGTANIAIQGRGVIRYSYEKELTFGNVEIGQTQSLCFNVINSSNVDIALDQVTSSMPEFGVATPMPLSILSGTAAEVCLTFAPTAMGPATSLITFKSSTGGNKTSTAQGVGVRPTSVADDALPSNMAVYPNPSSGVVTIVTGSEVAKAISFIGVDGRTVARVVPSGNTITVDLNGTVPGGVAAGTYTVLIETARGRYTTRIAVEK